MTLVAPTATATAGSGTDPIDRPAGAEDQLLPEADGGEKSRPGAGDGAFDVGREVM